MICTCWLDYLERHEWTHVASNSRASCSSLGKLANERCLSTVSAKETSARKDSRSMLIVTDQYESSQTVHSFSNFINMIMLHIEIRKHLLRTW